MIKKKKKNVARVLSIKKQQKTNKKQCRLVLLTLLLLLLYFLSDESRTIAVLNTAQEGILVLCNKQTNTVVYEISMKLMFCGMKFVGYEKAMKISLSWITNRLFIHSSWTNHVT